MSTSCVVARLDGSSGRFKGRYVHSDGMPTHTLRVIGELVREHGVEKVIKTVVNDHMGWSTLEGKKAQTYPWHDNERFQFVPGFGVAYTAQDHAYADWDGWVTSEDSDWVYILNPVTVSILHDNEMVAVIKYDDIGVRTAKQIEEHG